MKLKTIMFWMVLGNCVSLPVLGGTLSEYECRNHAQFVFSVADGGRDAGKSKQEVLEVVHNRIRQNSQLGPDDIRGMDDVINLVFANPSRTPTELADAYYNSCMSSKEVQN